MCEKRLERERAKYNSDPVRRYNKYRDNARRKQLVFDIPFNVAEEMFLDKCFYCGIEATATSLNGIDRKSCTFGYVLVNCVTCCSACNLMKGTMSVEDFITSCRRVAVHSV